MHRRLISGEADKLFSFICTQPNAAHASLENAGQPGGCERMCCLAAPRRDRRGEKGQRFPTQAMETAGRGTRSAQYYRLSAAPQSPMLKSTALTAWRSLRCV